MNSDRLLLRGKIARGYHQQTIRMWIVGEWQYYWEVCEPVQFWARTLLLGSIHKHPLSTLFETNKMSLSAVLVYGLLYLWIDYVASIFHCVYHLYYELTIQHFFEHINWQLLGQLTVRLGTWMINSNSCPFFSADCWIVYFNLLLGLFLVVFSNSKMNRVMYQTIDRYLGR